MWSKTAWFFKPHETVIMKKRSNDAEKRAGLNCHRSGILPVSKLIRGKSRFWRLFQAIVKHDKLDLLFYNLISVRLSDETLLNIEKYIRCFYDLQFFKLIKSVKV